MAYNHEYPYVDPNRTNGDWLLNKVKEFAATLDSWKDTILKLEEALKELDGYDVRITALENAVAALNPLIDEVAAIQGSIETLYLQDGDLNERIDRIVVNYEVVLESLARLQGLFSVYLALTKNYTDNELAKLDLKVKAQFRAINEEIEELKRLRPLELVNPVDASVNDLQTSYNKTYADMRDDAITCADFAETGITVSQFTALGLRAKEFALHSFSLFHLDYITAPVSGLYKPISHALSELLNFIIGSFSVSEFDVLDLTSDEFDALDYSVVDFLLANDSNTGLTASQFEDIIITGGSNILRL